MLSKQGDNDNDDGNGNGYSNWVDSSTYKHVYSKVEKYKR